MLNKIKTNDMKQGQTISGWDCIIEYAKNRKK